MLAVQYLLSGLLFFKCTVSSGTATRSTVLRRAIMDEMRETVGFTVNFVYFQMVKKEHLTDHVQLKIK